MEKFLTNEESLKLELEQSKQRSLKLEKTLQEKDLAIIAHQKEHLKLKIGLLDFETYKLQQKISQKNEQIKAAMEKAKEFHESLEEKYELEKGWGFNPDTNEIIQKEN